MLDLARIGVAAIALTGTASAVSAASSLKNSSSLAEKRSNLLKEIDADIERMEEIKKRPFPPAHNDSGSQSQTIAPH